MHALPDYPRYARHVALGPREGWPHARDFAARVLAIGNSPWLDDAGFDRICALLQQAVRTGG